jgi:hypothetical protein
MRVNHVALTTALLLGILSSLSSPSSVEGGDGDAVHPQIVEHTTIGNVSLAVPSE